MLITRICSIDERVIASRLLPAHGCTGRIVIAMFFTLSYQAGQLAIESDVRAV